MLEDENKANTITGTLTVPRIVTIFRKESSSAYFVRNAKFIPEGKVKIGSSITAVEQMKTNIPELNAYMPGIIGSNSNDPKYNEKLDLWFNNISKLVPETGLQLNVGFVFNDKAAKEAIEKSENEIYDRFNRAKKGTSKERDLAFKLRDQEIIALERTKYRYGTPINITDYLIWRYCLHYGDVANDIALINNSGGIRFYIYDSEQEKYKEQIQFDIRKQASITYVKLLEEPAMVNNMLWIHMGESVDIGKMSSIEKYTAIETLSKANPTGFINMYKDTDIVIKATIERMIHYGILKRLSGTSVIVDENNDVIGNDMAQAIVYFKNTELNKANITKFNSKLKNYTND